MDRLVGIWDYNVTKDVLSWDGNMCEIFGYSEPKKIGTIEMFKNLVHPDDLNTVIQKVKDTLEGKENQYNAIYRIVKNTGEEVIVHAWGSVFIHGNNTHLTGACDEITIREKIYREISKIRQGDGG